MATISYPEEESVSTIIDRAKAAHDESVTVDIADGSVFWQNPLNRILLEKAAQRAHKKIQYAGETDISQTERTETPVEVAVASVASTTGKKRFITKTRLIILILVLLLVGGAGSFVYAVYYLPSATVTLVVTKRSLQEKNTVTLRPEQSELDIETQTLPAVIRQTQAEESQQFQSTGTKQTGVRATGTIVVYNWRDVEVQLPVGHVFTVVGGQEGSGLEFTSTGVVTVPPREVTTEGPGEKSTRAGTAQVGVEAADIGEVYNVPGETVFSVAGYPNNDEGLQGINSSALTGGLTEDVQIISQDDINRAFGELQSTLEAKVKDMLEKEVTQTETLVADTVSVEILRNESSRAAGDEGAEFSATVAVRADGMLYRPELLQELVKQLVADSIPDGFVLADDELVLVTRYAGTNDQGFVVLEVTSDVLLLPDFDQDEIRDALAGKTQEEASQYLESLEHVSNAVITMRPRLPERFNRLPRRAERIDITISEEEQE